MRCAGLCAVLQCTQGHECPLWIVLVHNSAVDALLCPWWNESQVVTHISAEAAMQGIVVQFESEGLTSSKLRA